MTIFEQSRYFFNYVLPDIIKSNLSELNTFLGYTWWLFFLISVVLFLMHVALLREKIRLESIHKKLDDYLHQLSSKTSLKDIELYLLKSMNLIDAKYCALYELRSETYVLIESNAILEKSVAVPLRIGSKEVKKFLTSGNYSVNYATSNSENNMLLFFSSSERDLKAYTGFFNTILAYYEEISKNITTTGEGKMSDISRDTSISLMKLQMDRQQFFKFFVALVLKITKAKGAKLLTKTEETVFEYKPDSSTEIQKVFYIRNTPYKLEFYDDKSLKENTIAQVGSFLDMAGSFMMNSDKDSEIVQNYLDLLHFTNDAIELENIYYKNHSHIVQTVSVEIAGALFLSQKDIDSISLGAQLHDIGMIGDLLAILDQGKFEEQEMNLVKNHPLIGSILVEPISHIYPLVDILKFHHERYDGKGYPLGLKESQIPLNAQIVSLGEFYAGITGDRSYKIGKTHSEAIEEIQSLREKMFSNVIVDAFLDVEKNIQNKIEKIKSTES